MQRQRLEELRKRVSQAKANGTSISDLTEARDTLYDLLDQGYDNLTTSLPWVAAVIELALEARHSDNQIVRMRIGKRTH